MIFQKLRTFQRLCSAADMSSVLRWKTFPKGKVIRVSIGEFDIQIRARTSDLPLAIECLTSEYKSIGALFPRDFSGVMIDAGGHIGCASLRLASLFQNARIICIEPASDNLRLLRENIRSVANIEVRQAALVADGTGTITLSDRGRDGSGYSVVTDICDAESVVKIEDVPVVNISDLLDEFGDDIGFIKLDIEGAEADILNSRAFQGHNVPAVYVELHDRIRPGCTEAYEEFSKNRWSIGFGSEKYLSLSRN